MTDFRERAYHLISGGYDLHIHTNPSHISRSLNDFELVQQAAKAGMAGVMIKNHYEPTAGRAALVNQCSGSQTRAYGGVALNRPVGGLNPYAVESALKLGGSFVWLPTRDAGHCLKYGDMSGDFFARAGIFILDQDGRLFPEVYQIMEIVRKYQAVLATGHIGPEESITVCRVGCEMGIHVVLSHPEWHRTIVPEDIQAELADLGTIIEKNWYDIINQDCGVPAMMSAIRAVGPHRTYIATDLGQTGLEPPVEGMLRFIETLLQNGFTSGEITAMIHDVPKFLVDGK